MKNVFFPIKTKALRSLGLVALTFALISCQGKSGSSPEAKAAPEVVPNASMFSVWIPDNNSTTLDFTSFQFNTSKPITLGACTMNAVFEDQTDTDETDFVVMKFSNASPSGCSDLNGTWMINIEGDKMDMCAPPTWDTCYTYTKE